MQYFEPAIVWIAGFFVSLLKNEMQRFGARYVHTVSGEVIPNGIVSLDEAGIIRDISAAGGDIPGDVIFFPDGHLVPGFVNVHCHLELSHMRGVVPSGTGLVDFIGRVIRLRQSPARVIREQIRRAEREMIRNGIVAVGDISNTTDSFEQKRAHQLRYHTFVEVFDLFQEDTGRVWAQGQNVFDQVPTPDGHGKSLVPHAPYSVSDKLFRMLGTAGEDEIVVSIHNQETPAEDEFFLHKRGALVNFYKKNNLSLKHFRPTGQPSIYKAMEHLNPGNHTLFVHNTLTRREEIRDAQTWSERVFWATCPNANLYIENRLPDYRAFLDEEGIIAIGTDSLTSNWQLSVLEELKTISRYNSYIDFGMLIKWATLHGARALKMDDELGSLEAGKRPGLNVVFGVLRDGRLSKWARVKMLHHPYQYPASGES